MGGIVGRLFREFAVTLSVAILVSLVISLTTTPMMCSRLLKPNSDAEKHGRILPRQRTRLRPRCSAFYERTLGLGAATSGAHAGRPAGHDRA